jgi:hypothetical protein
MEDHLQIIKESKDPNIVDTSQITISNFLKLFTTILDQTSEHISTRISEMLVTFVYPAISIEDKAFTGNYFAPISN